MRVFLAYVWPNKQLSRRCVCIIIHVCGVWYVWVRVCVLLLELMVLSLTVMSNNNWSPQTIYGKHKHNTGDHKTHISESCLNGCAYM